MRGTSGLWKCLASSALTPARESGCWQNSSSWMPAERLELKRRRPAAFWTFLPPPCSLYPTLQGSLCQYARLWHMPPGAGCSCGPRTSMRCSALYWTPGPCWFSDPNQLLLLEFPVDSSQKEWDERVQSVLNYLSSSSCAIPNAGEAERKRASPHIHGIYVWVVSRVSKMLIFSGPRIGSSLRK